MSINKDLRSDLDIKHVFNVQDEAGATVATPFFPVGNVQSVTILLSAGKIAGGSNIVITAINESLDPGGAGANQISVDRIIGGLAKTELTPANFALTISRLGVFATKPYINVNLALAGTPLNDIMVSVILEPNVKPAINPED